MDGLSKNKFFYGWVIVAVATLALVISNGLSIGGIPVFYRSIREEFVAIGAVSPDHAESFIAFGATLTFFFAGMLSPFAGWLIARFPLKNLMAAGCIMLGVGLVLHASTDSQVPVYAARILMGTSLCLVGVLPSIVLVSNWFVVRRGLALGILLTGTSIGGVVIPQIATPMISAFGWRNAMLALSLIVWLILLPAVLFLVKDRPSDIGSLADGFPNGPDRNRTSTKTGSVVSGMSVTEAIRTPIFWIFAATAALVFYPIFVTTQQFILYLQSPKIGLSAVQGSFALSSLFFVSISGKFLFGYLSDRMMPTTVMLICCSVMFLSTLVLLGLSAATAYYFVLPFGFGYGGTFVLLQRLAADYFGNRDYPKILGILIVVETVGASVGGLITGRMTDAAGGDYTNAFYLVIAATGGALLLVVVLVLLSRRSNRRPASTS